MHQINGAARSAVAVVIIFVAFVWIGFAYFMDSKSERMFFHPVVPILLIVLLLGFKNEESLRHIIIVAIAFISIWIFIKLQNVFMPFVIGFALAYVVNVSIAGIQGIPIPLPKGKRFHLPKGAAVAVLIILLMGVISFFALGVIPQLTQQASAMRQGIIDFYNKVRDYTTKTVEELENGNYPFKDRLPITWQDAIDNNIDKITGYMQQRIPSTAKRASEIIAGILGRLSSGLINTIGQISTASFILIVFIYAVYSFRLHMKNIGNLFSEKHREILTRYAVEVDKNMRYFLRGQLTIIVAISIISIIVYSVIRVPFALLVGLMAGLLNIIPVIGPVMGGIIAGLASIVGFAAGNYGLTGLLIRIALVIGAAFGIQIIDNSLISPRILSSAIEVHPLIAMFAFLFSASFFGIWGALLAIPGIVVIKAVIKVSNEIRIEREAEELNLEK
jgi:predicted PurR-regulated permease PerM